uniref:Uncharacterized protein n=1 Tax=Silene vulgaris TaxID=42043 RepID=A0A3G2BRZ0_SILVU|nr:hypothetical protein [Silene vulgaris]
MSLRNQRFSVLKQPIFSTLIRLFIIFVARNPSLAKQLFYCTLSGWDLLKGHGHSFLRRCTAPFPSLIFFRMYIKFDELPVLIRYFGVLLFSLLVYRLTLTVLLMDDLTKAVIPFAPGSFGGTPGASSSGMPPGGPEVPNLLLSDSGSDSGLSDSDSDSDWVEDRRRRIAALSETKRKYLLAKNEGDRAKIERIISNLENDTGLSADYAEFLSLQEHISLKLALIFNLEGHSFSLEEIRGEVDVFFTLPDDAPEKEAIPKLERVLFKLESPNPLHYRRTRLYRHVRDALGRR